jgi:predicted MPP superfamily phosphohydrolase
LETIGSKRPVRIVQISDLHLHSVGRLEKLVIEEIQALRPDVILLTGDVIDRSDSLPALATFLAALPETRKFAVLGNWEFWSEVDLKMLKRLYETQQGVRLLINETETLKIHDRTIRVIGLDDFTAGMPNDGMLTTLEMVSGPTVLVQHSPGYFSNIPAKPPTQKIDLCLSGHTHAGQITFFGTPIWKPKGSGEFTAGWYNTKLCALFVSRGIGTSILPARFGARPEIAVFDL